MSDLTKQLKHAAWNTALTLAHNICIQESDQHNGNDELDEANTACYCAKRIRQFLDADDESLNEMMLEAGFASAIKSADLIEQLQARVVELEQKEAELKAYVERLRGVVTEYHDENIACEEALNTLWEIHNTTPQQNLNALRREAFIDGFYSSGDGFNGEWVGDKNTLDKLANEYANTKYPSGKE